MTRWGWIGKTRFAREHVNLTIVPQFRARTYNVMASVHVVTKFGSGREQTCANVESVLAKSVQRVVSSCVEACAPLFRISRMASKTLEIGSSPPEITSLSDPDTLYCVSSEECSPFRGGMLIAHVGTASVAPALCRATSRIHASKKKSASSFVSPIKLRPGSSYSLHTFIPFLYITCQYTELQRLYHQTYVMTLLPMTVGTVAIHMYTRRTVHCDFSNCMRISMCRRNSKGC